MLQTLDSRAEMHRNAGINMFPDNFQHMYVTHKQNYMWLSAFTLLLIYTNKENKLFDS